MTRVFQFQPVIIIGAGRSGTNMVRDLLTALPACATWPCDEINYIWRYGNAQFPSDELTAAHARPDVIHYIRRQFENCARKAKAKWLIEKTCANSLRVDFVRTVVPEARFIFLLRNGCDVAASAAKRWRASLDLRYVMKKAAYVPLRDLPYYGLRYAGHRLRRIFHREKRLPTWGPKCAGLDDWSATLATYEVCLRQWQACVHRASEQLANLPRDQVHFVRYEEFVTYPAEEIARMCAFLGIQVDESALTGLARTLYRDSVGKAVTPHWQELAAIARDTVEGVCQVWQLKRPARTNAA